MSSYNPSLKPKLSSQGGLDFALLGLASLLWYFAYKNLQALANFLSYELLGLSAKSQLGESVNFFFYDVPKILLLLTG